MGLFDFVGDIVTGIFDNEQQDQNNDFQREANAQNIALADRTNAQQLDIFNRGLAAQTQANATTVQTRVADAAKAGVHPLYALGHQGMSVSPGSVSFATPQVEPLQAGRNMGQNLTRALMSNMTKKERAENKMLETFNREREILNGTLDIERQEKQNNLLDLQIRAAEGELGMRQSGPPNVKSSTGPAVQPQPVRPFMTDPGKPSKQAGEIPEYTFSRTAKGGLAIQPGKDIKEAIEDSPQEWLWLWRNNVIPNMDSSKHRPDPRNYPLPKGYKSWKWSIPDQAFMPSKGY